MPARALAALLALALATAPGCLSPGEARPLRYWRVDASPADPTGAAASADAPALRLRDTRAAGHLRERLAVRSSPVRVEFLELDRWTEPPLAYALRALDRALFESGTLRRTDQLGAPTLDLALLAFDEVRGEGAPMAEVALALVLFDEEGTTLLERTLVERESLSGEGPEALATALTAALARVARRAASELSGALGAES